MAGEADDLAADFNRYLEESDDEDAYYDYHQPDLQQPPPPEPEPVQPPEPVPVPAEPSPEQTALERMLLSVTEQQLQAIARESEPKGKSARRRTSLTLTVLVNGLNHPEYKATKTDIANLNTIILDDVDIVLDLSDKALENLLAILNAASSYRVFAAASRVSYVRCCIRERCGDNPDRTEKFKRLASIVRRTDIQQQQFNEVALEKSLARQDQCVQVNKRALYKTISMWFGSGNMELAVLACQAVAGFRFKEVTSPMVQVWTLQQFMLFCPTFGDNNPPSLVAEALADPEYYIVNRGQLKKKGAPHMTCIKPLIGGVTAKEFVEFRSKLVGRTVHNRAANRRLRQSGESLIEDFRMAGRPLITHALRGVYVAVATADRKPMGCGTICFQNAILGYSKEATPARYQVCEAV